MRVKICGITQAQQARAIARLGATTLGFICVPTSGRYLTPPHLREILEQLPPTLTTVGVFANAEAEAIAQTVLTTGLTGIQLHGDESPSFCQQIRQILPRIELIKAFRLQDATTLAKIPPYYDCLDTILLDAYHPQLLGGTGQTLAWENLTQFAPPLPWLLAGGLTPDNITQALSQLKPDGIDVSSGVERQPGDKDLEKVKQLLEKIGRGDEEQGSPCPKTKNFVLHPTEYL